MIEEHIPASLPVGHTLDDRPVLARDLDCSDVKDAEVFDGLAQPVENSSRQQPRDGQRQRQYPTQYAGDQQSAGEATPGQQQTHSGNSSAEPGSARLAQS